ncbi:DUF4365 domain-containing protein [Salinivibrio costicola]|uniref:DUF4365 domain-containing protein n=1 Tax=Salinivibrio costicola subsp. alcaliphilus TaxID=272773 RepID=A0ABX3KM52_SALCS|nr:DUF4365 domain-containing protein [Salinivibrio costicola]OOF32790.1 hypothetical protein BZJ21_14200 [Salinivibrio costicola subsp. alcaliphilus]
MAHQYPQRINNHQLEEVSERHFRNHLPRNWTCDKPAQDYGVDLRVDLYDDQAATGLELLIQLKSSAESTDRQNETIRLATPTYNHLWDKLQVVMLVKYVERDDEAYWLLLSEVPEPAQEHDSFTIHIPKTNVLRNIDWNNIYDHVRNVTDEKLAARRRGRLQDERN